MDEAAITTYATKDYWLAGGLLASGALLVRLDWHNSKAFFIFRNRPICELRANAYWSGELMVSARAFADALRTLKTRIYENDRHPLRQ